MTKVIISGANVVLTINKGGCMYTASQVAKLAGISSNTLYHNRKKPGYPTGVERNRRVYFTEEEMKFFVKVSTVYKLDKYYEDGLKDGSVLTQESAAKYLGVSGQTLSNFQKKNKNPIPFKKKWKYVLFKKTDLDKFKDSGRSIKYVKMSKPEQKKKWKQARVQTSDPKKDTMIKPLEYPEHECTRYGCSKKTKNKFLCDDCKREFSGECGDSFHSHPRRNIGGAL